MGASLDTASRQARRLLEMSGAEEIRSSDLEDLHKLRSSRASIERSRDASSRDAREEIWRVLHQVPDPEIPVLAITDLGIVREATADRVLLTPTYTGCPATYVIERQVREALDRAGFTRTRIETTLTPPWTTDWITPEGRDKLRAYGIAPPVPAGTRAVHCPQCDSAETEEISRFGSTPCKALWRCRACLEPFDLFKCH